MARAEDGVRCEGAGLGTARAGEAEWGGLEVGGGAGAYGGGFLVQVAGDG
jgi:hypothetical protein